MPELIEPLEIGRGRIVSEGGKVAIVSLGTRLEQACLAAEQLEAEGLPATVADARFMKPLDTELIDRLVANHEMLITVEEGSLGGFGAHILHYLAQAGHLDTGLKVRSLTLPDVFIDHDKPFAMYEAARLNADSIVAAAKKALNKDASDVVDLKPKSA